MILELGFINMSDKMRTANVAICLLGSTNLLADHFSVKGGSTRRPSFEFILLQRSLDMHPVTFHDGR